MIYVQLYLALIFITAIPIFFFVALLFRKIARKQTLLGQRALARVNAFIQESVNGIQLAKTFRREDKLYEKFNEINEQSYKVNLKRGYVLNFIFPILNIIQAILLTLIVYFGGNMIIFGTIKAADLFLFTQGLTLFLFPIITISAFWPQFQAGLSAAERIFSIIDTSPVVKQSNSLIPKEIKGEIEFRNLTFQYKEDTKIFDNFSLKIRPGESLAIVGRTGAGKSTLANLLIRFYEFQEGDILIDDISIRDFDLNYYRKQIGYIPQTPFLFNETIENNIKYGKPEASHEEILETLNKIGGIEDWLGNLSDGLKTKVGERGQLISLGQRQLIAFTRVLLEDPKIFILDEATASVDPFTETKIQDTLNKIIKGSDRTSIVIAHRLWTVRHVDRIIVLEEGKIVEEGNHLQLMKKSGIYADLYNKYFRHQSYEYVEKCESLE
jgi:ABC-type multidrug transport system fused ATPase/permease subunit